MFLIQNIRYINGTHIAIIRRPCAVRHGEKHWTKLSDTILKVNHQIPNRIVLFFHSLKHENMFFRVLGKYLKKTMCQIIKN